MSGIKKVFKIKWTVIESEVYLVEAETFEEAKEKVLEYDMPDEIVEQRFEDITEGRG